MTTLQLADHKHIHCVGIGGIGLSAIAEIFLCRGYQVSGSDMKESDTVERLAAHGARIYIGHQASNVEGADLLVYSSAVGQDNPELQAAQSLGIPAASRAEVLGALMKEWPTSIAVSGTHGKTTTTSMISLILTQSRQDPTILVGGNLPAFGGNVRVGRGPHFVTEACEYMDNFLELSPTIEIILNIDSDHLDYFKDIDHIVSSFDRFSRLVPEDGLVIAFSANPFVSSIIKDLKCRVVTFGFNEQCDYHAADITFNAQGMPSFDLYYRDEKLCHLQLSIPGEHNIANALAAFGCCHLLGVPVESIASTLESYAGTQRRFDVIGVTSGGVRVVDDYGHHPTEIRTTLKATQNVPHNQLWCLFQPHTYTRTMALFNEFVDAFEYADKLILTEIYAAREKNIHKISARELVEAIRQAHPEKEVHFIEDFQEMADFVRKNAQPGDLVLTMGAGDIYKVAELILK
ncbi:MAG: UDP-N-acetylmuramate--L-alanine ligase [Bacillota bacterium]|nr:UDP-N-acetylmuramate--L-alanine ligase [Bacillota bacterium]